MPYKPQTICRYPGCGELTSNGYCDKHKKIKDAERETATQRGYNARWRKARVAYLASHPLCVRCNEQGRLTQATVVDHIIPHKGNYKLFWDINNWQPLCKQCHDKKTAAEDGGFGRNVKR